MDIATLGLRVESGQVVQAGQALDQLTSKAAAAEGATKRFERVQTDASRAGHAHRESLRQQAAAYQAAQAAVTQNTAAVTQATVTADRAHVSFGRFNNAIANLGLSAVGITGPMQKVVETIAILGVGSVVVTGALAGIAALVALHRKLTSDLREAQKAYDDWMTSVRGSHSGLALTGRLMDELGAKVARLNESGFLGSARRFTRGILSRSLLGQLFGIESQQELEGRLKGLTAQYDGLFDTLRGDAAKAFKEHHKAVSDAVAVTKTWLDTLDALSRSADKSVEALRRMNTERMKPFTARGLLGETSVTGPGFGGIDSGRIDRAAEAGFLAFEKSVAPAKEVAESWRDVSQSVANVVTLLANADDATLRMLGHVVDIVGQLESIDFKKLRATDIAGLVAGGVGLLSGIVGMFSEDRPETRRALEIQRENTAAIKRLTEAVGDFGKNITGAEFAAIWSRLSGANFGVGGLAGGLQVQNILSDLSGRGVSLSELTAVAKELDITFANVTPSLAELEQLFKAMANTELTKFARDFTGQLQALNAEFVIFGTKDPLMKLTRQLAVAGNILRPLGETMTGSPAIAGAAMGINFNTGAGRDAFRANIQELFRQLQSGTLTAEQLGGLTPQQFLDQLTSLIGLLDEIDAGLADTVKGLRAFTDSLKLDTSLTTLSPVEQMREARRQYEDVLARAMAGDQAAAGQLPASARAFLEASRAVNASGPQYAADFARVVAQTEAVARMFEGQMDVQQTIAAASTATQENTAQTVEELQAVVAVLSEGLTAAVDKLDALRVEQAENTRVLKQGLEGLAL